MNNVKDILLGRPYTPKSFILQGGITLLGAQVIKSVVAKISNNKKTSKENKQDALFRIGSSKFKSPWRLRQIIYKGKAKKN
jgi:hypothetical protein